MSYAFSFTFILTVQSGDFLHSELERTHSVETGMQYVLYILHFHP